MLVFFLLSGLSVTLGVAYFVRSLAFHLNPGFLRQNRVRPNGDALRGRFWDQTWCRFLPTKDTLRQLLLSHCKLRTTAADKFPKHPRRLAEDPTLGVAFKMGAHMFQKLRGLQKNHKQRSASRSLEKQSMPDIPATLCAPTHCNRMITCPSCPIP